MRKRNIISLILTIVLFVLTCKHWLIFKPMPVSFLAKGNGDYTFTVQFNKKDNDEFQKVKSCVIKKHLSGDFVKCECQIARLRTPKRLRLIVNATDLTPIEIKEFSLKNGKVKFPDLSNFSSVNVYAGGGGDFLVPQNKTFSFTYDKPLKLRSSIKFEALTFIIIAILGYLLSFKLTSYLADFKVLNHYSRIDIVFLAICTLLMYLPMSNISNAKTSRKENRNLAPWISIIKKDGSINYNFGRDYDKWFSDRFNFRNLLLELNSEFIMDKNQPNVIIGKDGWLFYRGEDHRCGVRNFLNLDLFTQNELEYIANYLVSVDEYCKSRNKKFYFFIGPDKNKIYGEFYPDYMNKNIPDSNSRAMQLIDYLRSNTNVKVIYPYSELHEAKKNGDLLYWKNDTHWNSLGGYIGYKTLMQALIEDRVDIKVVKPDKFVRYKAGVKELDNMLVGIRKSNSADVEYNDAYIYPAYEFSIKDTTKNDIFSHNDMFSHKNIKAPKLVMFRDSFTRAMIPFISNTFSDVSYYWTHCVSKNRIEDADIVVLESVERMLSRFVHHKFKD